MKQLATRKKSATVTSLPGRVSADEATTGRDGPPSKPASKTRSALPETKARKERKALVNVAAAGATLGGKERAKKEKVVRDTFTMPRADYEKIAVLKQRCLDAGVAVKKSELLRAALLLLESVPHERLLEAVTVVEPVKTGRPPKSKGAAGG
jgi:hypothetical protein